MIVSCTDPVLSPQPQSPRVDIDRIPILLRVEGLVHVGHQTPHHVLVRRVWLEGGLQQTVVAEKVKHLVDPEQGLLRHVSLHEGLEQCARVVHGLLQVAQVEAELHLVERDDRQLRQLELLPEPIGHLQLLLVQCLVPVQDPDLYHSFDHVLDHPFGVSLVAQLQGGEG